MDFSPSAPIWLQVAFRIRGDIVSGKLKPGEKLPGSRDLALKYAINPNTAARVYQELEREGICSTRRGMGTYVTEDSGKIDEIRREMAQKIMDAFLQSIAALGMSRQDAIQLLKYQEENENAGKQ